MSINKTEFFTHGGVGSSAQEALNAMRMLVPDDLASESKAICGTGIETANICQVDDPTANLTSSEAI